MNKKLVIFAVILIVAILIISFVVNQTVLRHGQPVPSLARVTKPMSSENVPAINIEQFKDTWNTQANSLGLSTLTIKEVINIKKGTKLVRFNEFHTMKLLYNVKDNKVYEISIVSKDNEFTTSEARINVVNSWVLLIQTLNPKFGPQEVKDVLANFLSREEEGESTSDKSKSEKEHNKVYKQNHIQYTLEQTDKAEEKDKDLGQETHFTAKFIN